MNRFVADASVVLSWCFPDEADAYSEKTLDALRDGEATAPALLLLECANVFLVCERKKRISRSDSLRFIQFLEDLGIDIKQMSRQEDLLRIVSLARMHDLTSYDAAYLDLALREGIPLATKDGALRRAASKCGLPDLPG